MSSLFQLMRNRARGSTTTRSICREGGHQVVPVVFTKRGRCAEEAVDPEPTSCPSLT
jgi:hypothetical protein